MGTTEGASELLPRDLAHCGHHRTSRHNSEIRSRSRHNPCCRVSSIIIRPPGRTVEILGGSTRFTPRSSRPLRVHATAAFLWFMISTERSHAGRPSTQNILYTWSSPPPDPPSRSSLTASAQPPLPLRRSALRSLRVASRCSLHAGRRVPGPERTAQAPCSGCVHTSSWRQAYSSRVDGE